MERIEAKEIDRRVAQLRVQMAEHKMDAYLVPTADFHESEYVGEYFKSRHFLTGFNGTAGTAVITREDAGMWTDGRYFVQAENQMSGSCVRLCRMGDPEVPGVAEYLEKNLPEGGVLGFDGRVVNAETGLEIYESIRKKGCTISCDADLVGEIWKDRPEMSCRPVWILDEKYTGKSYREKRERLLEKMSEAGAELHLMTALDEIAWLLNLRGDDIANNPVFLSNMIFSRERAILFVQEAALSREVREYLQNNEVEIRPYHDFIGYVRTFRNCTILLEKKKISYAVLKAVDESCQIRNIMNPCAQMKACKNETEIANMKKAHLKDGIAVTKFMYWLKHLTITEETTEMTAARKIEALRKEQGGYIETSFTTIAAYRENAAMCHYHPSDEVQSRLKPEGLLLVDSGGHYYEGTTDITRTFALGPLTEREKEYFTIVACSMLKAGDMKFLHGCSGLNLDYTIREAFWKRGLDFNHGTGHGVGFVANVHERPNGLRWKVVPERQDSAVIEPGMICSDEPGLYFEGEFGTRTENLILCVPDEKNRYGQFLRFEFLTWAPIDLDAIDVRFMDEHDIERLNRYHKEVYRIIAPHLTKEEQEWLAEATREVSAAG